MQTQMALEADLSNKIDVICLRGRFDSWSRRPLLTLLLFLFFGSFFQILWSHVMAQHWFWEDRAQSGPVCALLGLYSERIGACCEAFVTGQRWES
jgi:hypothetical protein